MVALPLPELGGTNAEAFVATALSRRAADDAPTERGGYSKTSAWLLEPVRNRGPNENGY
jgi:hypothetical protein